MRKFRVFCVGMMLAAGLCVLAGCGEEMAKNADESGVVKEKDAAGDKDTDDKDADKDDSTDQDSADKDDKNGSGMGSTTKDDDAVKDNDTAKDDAAKDSDSTKNSNSAKSNSTAKDKNTGANDNGVTGNGLAGDRDNEIDSADGAKSRTSGYGTTADEDSVSGELGDSVRDLGDGVGDAVEDVGEAVDDAVNGR